MLWLALDPGPGLGDTGRVSDTGAEEDLARWLAEAERGVEGAWEAAVQALVRSGRDDEVRPLLEAYLPGPDEDHPLRDLLFQAARREQGVLGDPRPAAEPGWRALAPSPRADRVLALGARGGVALDRHRLQPVPGHSARLVCGVLAVAPSSRSGAVLLTRASPGGRRRLDATFHLARWRGEGSEQVLASISANQVVDPIPEDPDPDPFPYTVGGPTPRRIVVRTAAVADDPPRALLWVRVEPAGDLPEEHRLVVVHARRRGEAPRVGSLPAPGRAPSRVLLALSPDGDSGLVGDREPASGPPGRRSWRGQLTRVCLRRRLVLAQVPVEPGLLEAGYSPGGEHLVLLFTEGGGKGRLEGRDPASLALRWRRECGRPAPRTAPQAPRVRPGSEPGRVQVLLAQRALDLDAATGDEGAVLDPGTTGPLLDLHQGEDDDLVVLHSARPRAPRDPGLLFDEPTNLGGLSPDALFPRRPSQGHQARVVSVWIAATGRRAASLDAAGVAMVWDLRTGSCLHQLGVGSGPLAFDPGLTRAAWPVGKTLRVLDLEPDGEDRRLSTLGKPRALGFDARGEAVVVVSRRGVIGHDLSGVGRKSWFRRPEVPADLVVGTGDPGRVAVASTRGKGVELLAVEDGEVVDRWQPSSTSLLTALHPGNAQVLFWARTGGALTPYMKEGVRPVAPRRIVPGRARVTLDPQGNFLLVADGRRLSLRSGRGPDQEVAHRKLPRDLRGPAEAPRALRPDGRLVLEAQGTFVRLLDLPR